MALSVVANLLPYFQDLKGYQRREGMFHVSDGLDISSLVFFSMPLGKSETPVAQGNPSGKNITFSFLKICQALYK